MLYIIFDVLVDLKEKEMKKLFGASFEQTIKMNDDDLIIECLEISSIKRILYRLLGPWVQGGLLLFIYFLCLCAMYDIDHIPDLAFTHFLYQYIVWYGIIYTVIQLILCRYQVILSNIFFHFSIGQYMIIFSALCYFFWVVGMSTFAFSSIIIALTTFLSVISILYLMRQEYFEYMQDMYDEQYHHAAWVERIYLKGKEKGNTWIMGGMFIIMLISGHPLSNLEGLFCVLFMPMIAIYMLAMAIDETFYSVKMYYLVKYSEQYREYYGLDVSEWYGKYSRRAMKERRFQRKAQATDDK